MGATITELDALDLVNRLVTNQHGVEFVVTRLSLNAQDGRIWIWLDEMDLDGRLLGNEIGIPSLDSFTIHQPLGPADWVPLTLEEQQMRRRDPGS